MSRRSDTPVALQAATFETAMSQATDDRARGGRLARVHAGAGQGNDRHACCLQWRICIQLLAHRPVPGPRCVRPGRGSARPCRALRSRTAARHPGLPSRRCRALRRCSGVCIVSPTASSWAGARSSHAVLCDAQSADDDITLVDRRHAARCQFELVVACLVIQYAHGTSTPSSQGISGGQPQLVPEVAVLCDRGDLVDDDASS